MAQRFVIMPADEPLRSEGARRFAARVALRDFGPTLTAGGPAGSGGMMAGAGGGLLPWTNDTLHRAANRSGLREDDVRAAESNGPQLSTLKVVRRISGVDGDEPILVALDDQDRHEIQRAYPGAQLVPEGTARMAIAAPELRPWALEVEDGATMAGATPSGTVELRVKVVDAEDSPLGGVVVAALVDRTPGAERGGSGSTARTGIVRLPVPSNVRSLYVRADPKHSFWPTSMQVEVNGADIDVTLVCQAVDKDSRDCVRETYSAVAAGDGKDVVVAVIDGGAGPHRRLAAASGMNLADEEDESDWADNGIGHGTHVAGLIGGTGPAVAGGLAPAATLRIYRVYQKGLIRCGSFAVASAIRQAVADGADIINMSLTLDRDQPEIERELKRAIARGVLVVAAAGNIGGDVQFPARRPGIVGVSAYGIRKSAGDTALPAILDDLRKSPAGAQHLRMALFSNFGPEIDLTAPGVGVVSLYPKQKLAVMKGTSMAAPVVTARIAARLSADRVTLEMDRTSARSEALLRLAIKDVESLGFPEKYQGHGRPA